MIYTSGSTGQPKGVLTHSAPVNFTRCAVDQFRLDASDRLLQFLSPSMPLVKNFIPRFARVRRW